MPNCDATIGFSPFWNHSQFAEQVRKQGWFIWHDRLVCPRHLHEDGPGPAPRNVIDFPLQRALNGVTRRSDGPLEE
jgi:hypothetical protein